LPGGLTDRGKKIGMRDIPPNSGKTTTRIREKVTGVREKGQAHLRGEGRDCACGRNKGRGGNKRETVFAGNWGVSWNCV